MRICGAGESFYESLLMLEDIKMQMILLCPHFIFNEPADINPYFTRQRKWELIMALCKTGLTWSCLKLPKIPT